MCISKEKTVHNYVDVIVKVLEETSKLTQWSLYEFTNRALAGVGCQWLPVATNNLLIDD